MDRDVSNDVRSTVSHPRDVRRIGVVIGMTRTADQFVYERGLERWWTWNFLNFWAGTGMGVSAVGGMYLGIRLGIGLSVGEHDTIFDKGAISCTFASGGGKGILGVRI
jgi:hypothetical protein